jgi:chemotaxis protein MotB
MSEGGGGESSIIIKKVKKGHGGAHGGAWKLAYADFVTAMMAFFLLMWLLNSVTQEQLEGIANHFAPTAVSQSNSGAGDVLGGKVLSEEGAQTAESSRSSVAQDLPPPKAGEGSGGPNTQSSTEAAEEAAKAKEEKQFDEAKKELEEKIKSNPSFRRLAKSLMIDNTPEGLRIQIIDQDGLAMFPSGKATMYLHTKRVVEMVVGVIEKMTQKLAISGHTDSVKFGSGAGYTNWELSADRANAARRALLEFGLDPKRLGRVVGKAATDPLLKDNPEAARNRCLSIILLRGTGKDAKPKQAAPEKPEALPGLDDIQKKQLQQ